MAVQITRNEKKLTNTQCGILCLFEEDREQTQKRLSEGGYIPGRLDFSGSELDLSRVEPLTPAEQLECKNIGNEPGRFK